MKKIIFASVVTLAVLVPAASAQVTYGGGFAAIPIPDGAGACVAGAAVAPTITVPPGPAITAITVTMGLTHTWYGDLRIFLDAPGGAPSVNFKLLGCTICDDSSNLGGLYTIDDAAAGSWCAAATAAGGTGALVPPGTYTADSPLAPFIGIAQGGTWTLRVDDTFGADVGTINHFALTITPGSCNTDYTLTQAGAGAPYVFTQSCGTPFALFVAPVALHPVTTLGGWLNGLEIDIVLLMNELSAGAPFMGALDVNGDYSISIPPILPAGIKAGTTTFHFSGSPTPSFTKPAFEITLQ